MYGKLLNCMQTRPPLYAMSTAKFWDDDYISSQMLEAHLNPKTDAASRSHAFIEASARWIAAQAGGAAGKKLLDLGCGPGLYAAQFDGLGFCVTGIDLSRRSIEYAAGRAKQEGRGIRYHQMDYLDMDYEQEFDVAVLIFCDFGVLSKENRDKLLQQVRRALKPGGMLVLDGFTIRNYDTFGETQSVSFHQSGFWKNEPYLLIERRLVYQENTFLEQYIVVSEQDCDCYNIWNHAFDAKELKQDFENAGFAEVSVYGDVCGAPYGECSETICIAAR